MPDEALPTSSPPRFRVAIVGGGIAGLALAVTLGLYEDPESRARIQIDMYEANAEITTVGAGISVWPRTWEVMRTLGLYEELEMEAVKERGRESDGKMKSAFIYRKSDWEREGYEFGRVSVPNGSTTMHRAEMVEVFVRHLPPHCAIHTSKRFVRYTERAVSSTATNGASHNLPVNGAAYTLHFADGTTAEADVLVGADGIKSKTRASMYGYAHAQDCVNPESELRTTNGDGVGAGGAGAGENGHITESQRPEECERCKRATPQWAGTIAYRHLIPSEQLRAINPRHRVLETPALMSYSGKGKHVITYPISHGKYINWVGFVTVPGAKGTTYPRKWVTDASRDEVAAHYAGWEPEVGEMLACIDKPTLWAIHAIEDLPFSVRGRVALMGDAVHAMETHFGAGGGQAIEDAYVLGRLLADPRTTLDTVADVLKIYQAVRLPFAQRVVRDAARVGRIYELDVGAAGLRPLGTGPDVSEDNGAGAREDLGKESADKTKARLDELGRAIEEMWTWQVREEVRTEWEEAERKFEELMRRGRGRDDKVRDAEDGKGARETRKAGKTGWKGCVVM